MTHPCLGTVCCDQGFPPASAQNDGIGSKHPDDPDPSGESPGSLERSTKESWESSKEGLWGLRGEMAETCEFVIGSGG